MNAQADCTWFRKQPQKNDFVIFRELSSEASAVFLAKLT